MALWFARQRTPKNENARLLAGRSVLIFQEKNGAAERNRTFDLTLTKGMLYRLSYGSNLVGAGGAPWRGALYATAVSPRQATFLDKIRILDRRAIPPTIRAMTKEKSLPELSAKGKSEAELRRQREAEALRANLMRRKAQARGRTEDAPADQPADGGPAEG